MAGGKLRRGHIYPGEFLIRDNDGGFTWEGEAPRMIQPGEYYFSGSEIQAYHYPGIGGGTVGPFHPATKIKTVCCPYCRGKGKVREPREK